MFGKFIRQQRTRHNMTHEYLASAFGMSRPTYMQIEREGRELRTSEAKKLAAIFEMPLEDFLAAKEPKHNITSERKSAQKSGNLLREYRTSLISAAVTDKIDFRKQVS